MLELADGRELRFRDIRKFGRVGLYRARPAAGELVTEAGGPAVFAGSGPEPLDPAFTLAAFRRGCAGRTGRLKPLLLDQSFIAGIGNIYADEALWAARLHPLRSAAIAPAGRRAAAVRRRSGRSWPRRSSGAARRSTTTRRPTATARCRSDSTSTSATGEPCPRCGRPIRRIVIGARATHFCSWCQRLLGGRPQGRRGGSCGP